MLMTAEKGKIRTRNKIYLTSDDISELLVSLVNGSSKVSICTKYGITCQRLNNIISTEGSRIERIRIEQALRKEKEFRGKVIDKRSEIIDKITPEDIENASLSQKTSSIVDLTKVKQLEEGGSTENIAINVNSSSKQDILDYILNNETVNKTEIKQANTDK